MRVEQFLNDSATRFGKKAAIVVAGRQHSYADLARSSDRVAAALRNRGVLRGDRVALFMDDNFEAVVSAFAVLKAGAVASPIHARSDAATLARILSSTGAVAMVTGARLASVAAAAMSSVGTVRLVVLCGGDRSTASRSCLIFEELIRGFGPGPCIERVGPPSDPALLLQAIGPDGESSEATLTHAEVVAAATAVDHTPRMHSSILSHRGLCQLLAAIRAGATLVLETPSAFRHVTLAGDGVPALAI